jgi:hypothetical protein
MKLLGPLGPSLFKKKHRYFSSIFKFISAACKICDMFKIRFLGQKIKITESQPEENYSVHEIDRTG